MDMDGCGAAWHKPVGCALRLGRTEACDRLRRAPGAARRRGARLWDKQSGRGGCPHPGTAKAADRRSSREAAPPWAGRRSLLVHIGRGATPLSGRAEPGGPAHRQCAVSRARSGCGGCEGIGEGEAKQLANSQCGVESRKRRCADGGHVGSASTVQKLLVTCWV
jgi:hypothetical protein